METLCRHWGSSPGGGGGGGLKQVFYPVLLRLGEQNSIFSVGFQVSDQDKDAEKDQRWGTAYAHLLGLRPPRDSQKLLQDPLSSGLNTTHSSITL